ncbi:MAG: ABC transporter ATP-binding protein, partial [Erysipelotrichaceae bacterium]|nr:ABC transporter ATP-binding protein [Erysipelotrichaceae bacterium]
MKKLIEFRNIVKAFGSQVVLKGINLDIYENEFVTLLGPSGCGKTTLLRILGGFLNQDSGEVILDGKEISNVPAYQRPINTVFQRYALFPHLDVFDNVAFGLRIKKMSEDLIKPKVERMISLVGLEGFEHRDISMMSGGQQQRVAIARALVNEPDVLLLDEPLSALDRKLRVEMQQELKRIQQEVGITFIFVTHDQEEALTMSDKIVVMRDGGIQQIGTPLEIYNTPNNRYVANFIGNSNIVDGMMKKDYLVKFDDREYECVDFGFKPNELVDVIIRPEDIRILPPNKGKLNGQVLSVLFKGVHYETIVETRRGASKTVTLHVVEGRDTFNKEANEMINATDFTIDIEDVKNLTNEDLIAR